MPLSDQHWVYSVPLVNSETGERRVVLVELSPEERQDALYNLAVNPNGPGGDRGCIVNSHASWRALRIVGVDGWQAIHNEIERVQGNVRTIQ